MTKQHSQTNNRHYEMALEIRPTPVLKGKAAENFLKKMDKSKANSVDFKKEAADARAILEKAKNAKKL